MATPDPGLNARLDSWLDDWQRWLELWLVCGVANPSREARAALARWQAGCELAGWHRAGELAAVLLDGQRPAAEKSRALLDLLAWQQVTRRLRQAGV